MRTTAPRSRPGAGGGAAAAAAGARARSGSLATTSTSARLPLLFNRRATTTSNPTTTCAAAAGAAATAAGAAAAALATILPAAAAPCNRRRHRSRRAPLSAAAASRGRDDNNDDGSGEDSDREPDWDEEMSIFKQRTMRPNQLATLRQMEGQASVGKVLHVGDSLAVLSGVNPDAPLGTALAFVSGAAGVLLWHRSDDLAFAIVLGGAAAVRPGEGVECRVKGVLQLVDEALGPVTRKEFELWQSPADDAALAGRAVDFLGRPLAGFDPVVARAAGGGAAAPSGGAAADPFAAAAPPVGMARTRPLVNEQVPMKSREQIGEALVTGVRGLDALTPLGRGSSLLVVGPAGSGKTALARDAVLAQSLLPPSSSSSSSPSPVSPSPSPGGAAARPPAPAPVGGRVRCFYASTTQDAARLQAMAATLLSPSQPASSSPSSSSSSSSSQLQHDPSNVTIFASSPKAPLGERLATLCAACAAAERVRDKGGHALVVLDDVSALSEAWEHLVQALVELGPERLREGLVKDSEGRDLPVVPPPSAAATAEAAAAGGASAAPAAAPASKQDATPQQPPSSSSLPGDAAVQSGAEDDDDGGLVEYEGMLVSGAVAQRRGFYSTLFMRAAKVHRALGGGTMTLLPLVPGKPATGARAPGVAVAAAEGGGGQAAGGVPSAAALVAAYPSLSEEQRRKLGEALAKKAREAAAASEAAARAAAPHELRTEIVEEFISISDGQAVMDVAAAAAAGAGGAAEGAGPAAAPSSSSSSLLGPARYALNPRLSVTRIGARAYERALAELAPQARLELAQADDALRFGGATTASPSSSSSRKDAEDAAAARARRLAAALVQPAGSPTPLEELALLLFAVRRGYADAVPPEEMGAWAERAVSFVRQVAPRALREVAATRQMTAAAEKAVADALEAMASAGGGRGGVAAAAAARVVGGGGGGGGAGGSAL
jgi:F0F1-type ATP synthase alpha subunit